MLDRLEVFFGDANNALARVYARLESAELPIGCELRGSIVGPTCEYSHTLSASIPLMARRSSPQEAHAPALLSEAIVPDACFWSPELPFLYQAQIELRSGGAVLATAQRTFGIRPLGAYRRRLVWAGRAWVLRAADRQSVPERPLADWRAADLAMLVENANDDLCHEASRLGVVLVVELTSDADDVPGELRRLARWPAVAAAVLDHAAAGNFAHAGKNLLLADRYAAHDTYSPIPWANIVVCEAASAEDIARQAAGIGLPVVAQRSAGWCDDLAQARRHCDQLQRELAGLGDFAGYLV